MDGFKEDDMIMKKSFLTGLRRLTLCLMVLFMFNAAVAPSLAQAGVPVFDPTNNLAKIWGDIKKAAEWVQKETFLGKIIATLVEIYNMLKNMFGMLNDTMSTSGVVQSMSQRLRAETMIRIHDAQVRAEAEDALAAARAGYMAKYAAPPHQELCKTILVHQLVTTTNDFVREISRLTAEAVANRDRAYTDGTGVDQAAVQYARRCSQKRMGPVDGVPSCVASGSDKSEGTMGGDGIDADLSPVREGQIYEVPKFVGRIYTDPNTGATLTIQSMGTPTTDPQRFFVAAVDHLFLAAGSRPTPLNGDKLKTPNGIVQRTMFNHCAANENALIKQCTDRLAYYTRPNSQDPQGAAMRKAQKSLCDAIDGTIDKKRFGNCDQGLSAFEAQKLAEMWCSSVQQAIGLKAAGVSDGKVRKASDICEMVRLTGQSMRTQMRLNCVSAMAALPGLRQCWNTVEALGGKSYSSNEDKAAKAARWQILPDDAAIAPEGARIHQIKATKLKQSIPQGKTMSLDEIELPVAVGQ